MKSGWTGAQYSLYRGLLSLLIAWLIGSRLAPSLGSGALGPHALLLALGLPATVALALGWRDRWAAALLFAILLVEIVAESGSTRSGLPSYDLIFALPLLALHLAVPPAPFGSWDARGRIDPAGGWQRPRWIGHTAWGIVAFVSLLAGLASSLVSTQWASRYGIGVEVAWLSWLGLVLTVGFAIATFRTRWRPALWLSMALWRVAWISAFGPHSGDASLALLLVMACEPSAWWPGRSARAASLPGAPTNAPMESPIAVPGTLARLFYDGDCGFCHRSVRFVLAEESGTPEPLRLRFAPLASRTFDERLVGLHRLDARSLPDSIVVELEDGSILVRSAAAIEIASRLGGLWLALALVSRGVPRGLLDWGYDTVARVRKRLFAAPKDSCPILPPALRTRFDP